MPQEVSTAELAKALGADAFVLDVRESWEFENGHVPNAHHVALNTIPDNLDLIPKDKKIWIICQSGGRSMTAANYLEAQGFDVVSVAGGTGAWIGSGNAVSMEASL